MLTPPKKLLTTTWMQGMSDFAFLSVSLLTPPMKLRLFTNTFTV